MNILFFLTPKAEVACVDSDDNLRQVLEKMENHGYSAIPLLSTEGKYIGTITEGDVLWKMRDENFPSLYGMEKIKVVDVPRRRDNKAVRISETMEHLFDKIKNQNFVPVLDDEDIFIGIVTRKDILMYLESKL